ncbi:MAG: hypothetical protein ACREHG_10955 [Candidatus Saccharimonadales bacterium]
MQEPNPKHLPVYLPEFLVFGVGFGLALLYDGRVYDDFPGFCQRCKSKRCRKAGLQPAIFARLIVKEGKFLDVKVLLQRHLCKECGGLYVSNGPFYDDAMYGSQIVDLALTLSMDNSSYGVEKAMMNLGIQLDSDSILDYVRLFADRCKKHAPLLDVGSPEPALYGINLLKILFGVNNAKELSEKFPEVNDLQSLMDETYLKKKGALKKFVQMIKGSTDRRIVRRGINSGKDIVIKDGAVVFPESFTLALSYMPGADAFASLICTEQPFNQILASILFKSLEGTTSTVTDGSRSYNEIKNRIGCTVHKTRSELKRDENYKQLKKEARELVQKKKVVKTDEEKKQIDESFALKRSEMRKYAQDKYAQVVNSTIEELRGTHSELFDDERRNFHGCTTTNGMEGGNWRVKYAVRVPHQRNDSATGRSLLAALKDSIFGIRGGKVRESLANKIGIFSFSNMMAAK